LAFIDTSVDRIKPSFYRVFSRIGLDIPTIPTDEYLLDYPPSSTSFVDVGHFVRHIMVGGYHNLREDQLIRMLTLCFNATDVALWVGEVQTHPAVKSALLQLPLQRLSADLSHLQRSDFLTPSFQSITHLHVINMGSKRVGWNYWEILTSLPKLTHICISKNVEVEAINNLLSQCVSLSLLVAVIGTSSHRHTKPSGSYHTIDDHRLILVDRYGTKKAEADWEDGANGRPDMWDFCGLIRDARDGTPYYLLR